MLTHVFDFTATACFFFRLCFSRGKLIYDPPRYMTVTQCIEQLLEIEDKRKENGRERTGQQRGKGSNSVMMRRRR